MQFVNPTRPLPGKETEQARARVCVRERERERGRERCRRRQGVALNSGGTGGRKERPGNEGDDALESIFWFSKFGKINMGERRVPTAEDVLKKIKDDGDFDALRLKIIRVVKENEDLRKNIVDQVKQSDVLNHEGSEDLKPRQLSDAIYQELGRKIMGQISDEIWKTIRLNDSIKDDIRSTVEHVFNKMFSTEAESQRSKVSNNSSFSHEILIAGREANGLIKTSITTPTREANILNSNETNEPPAFASSADKIVESKKNSDLQENEQSPVLIQNTKELFKQAKDQPPGLGSSRDGSGGGGGGGCGGEADDDFDLPPGFS